MIRRPAVAGQFYPSQPAQLLKEVARCLEGGEREVTVPGGEVTVPGGEVTVGVERQRVLGVLSPHAGYMYSGKVAGAVYSRIEFPQTFILLGPNHTGMGSPVSIMSSGRWQTPIGEIEIDEPLAERLIRHSKAISEDAMAHLMEHSLEVQIPFILYLSKDVRIVPIVFMIDSLDICREIGKALTDVIKDVGYPVTIVASSDMSHYETDSVARSKDRMAIDRILAIDPDGLYRTVKTHRISMCGYIPAVTMLYAVKGLGAASADLVMYATSGDVSGDYDYVVGYAGIIIR
ncbi:MAG: AmmeMemoRadiSam system protein B [Thermodesulfovibrionia bacterium]